MTFLKLKDSLNFLLIKEQNGLRQLNNRTKSD